MVAIPDEPLRCVIFLSVHSGDGRAQMPRATAFLATIPIEGSDPEIPVAYFVTARHCLEQARAEGHDTIYLRLNLSESQRFEEFPTRIDDWFTADHADVAAVPFVPALQDPARDFREFDIVGYQSERFVGPAPQYMYSGPTPLGDMDIHPRVGSEVFLTGLFTEDYGQEANLPIARFGHIARMPSSVGREGPDGTLYEEVAYLAEFQSWGGVSGSPVYFLEPRTIHNIVVDEHGNETETTSTDHGWVTGLLGLVSGHYEIPRKGETTGEVGSVRTALNSGIAVVVPASEITQLLTREDLVHTRGEVLKHVRPQ